RSHYVLLSFPTRRSSDLGYQIFEAASGVEALEGWGQHDGVFDLLLTDMVMPGGVTGRELAEKLLADKPELKVIFTRGYSTDMVGDRKSTHLNYSHQIISY